jgi:MvdD-like protein with pre-ATP grasp domain
MLLILTSNKDLTADFLIVDLVERQLPYFRLNADDLASAAFTFFMDQHTTQRIISVGPRSLDLSEVTAVWYRRAIHPIAASGATPGERFFISGELRHLTMGLVWNPHICWVNPIDRVSIAEQKLYQLQIARRLGFRVPRTLISRDRNELQQFATSNSTGTICKPIFHGMLAEGISRYSIYTRRIDPSTLDADCGVECPILLQEEVPRIADVRATFIGARCFVADIKGEVPLIDWRDPEITVGFSESRLDDTTEDRCRTMLHELGLVYGAFDFIRTPGGDLVFLEVNPTGEWAWLENELGFPMREAFVQLFFGRQQ